MLLRNLDSAVIEQFSEDLPLRSSGKRARDRKALCLHTLPGFRELKQEERAGPNGKASAVDRVTYGDRKLNQEILLLGRSESETPAQKIHRLAAFWNRHQNYFNSVHLTTFLARLSAVCREAAHDNSLLISERGEAVSELFSPVFDRIREGVQAYKPRELSWIAKHLHTLRVNDRGILSKISSQVLNRDLSGFAELDLSLLSLGLGYFQAGPPPVFRHLSSELTGRLDEKFFNPEVYIRAALGYAYRRHYDKPFFRQTAAAVSDSIPSLSPSQLVMLAQAYSRVSDDNRALFQRIEPHAVYLARRDEIAPGRLAVLARSFGRARASSRPLTQAVSASMQRQLKTCTLSDILSILPLCRRPQGEYSSLLPRVEQEMNLMAAERGINGAAFPRLIQKSTWR